MGRKGLFAVEKIIFSLPLPSGFIFMFRGHLRGLMKCLHRGIKSNYRQPSLGNLRRNIHRIEKGLSHLDRKPVFALDYVAETVRLYCHFSRTEECGGCHAQSVLWARKVLEEYFRFVSKTPFLQQQKEMFEQVSLPVVGASNGFPAWVPYPAGHRAECSIDFDSFLQLALRRRSVRQFDGRSVEKEVLEKALSVARLSPSACNRQSYRFNFFMDAQRIQSLSSLPGGMADFEGDIPCLCVLTVDYSHYFHERDILVPALDVGLAAMSFQYALETMGVSSVCVNWPINSGLDRKIRHMIDLDDAEMPILFMALGYSAVDGMIPASCKKSVGELSRFDQSGEA